MKLNILTYEYIKNMSTIQYQINRIKKNLLANEGTLYPCMANVEFKFCSISSITIHTNNKQYFIDKFGMKDYGDELQLWKSETDSINYNNLLTNAKLIMLKQSLNDPRPIIRMDNDLFRYKHGFNGDVDDELDILDFDDTNIDTYNISSYDGEFDSTVGTMEEYVAMVKKLWNGTNSAYNIYSDTKDVIFDTYPAYQI